jgi:membrane protein
LIITLLFGALFKWMPDAEVTWRDVLVGALATSVLFLIGQALIGLYLGSSRVGSPFGAAGSLAVLLVWIYYSAMIFLLGAEFTEVWARLYGSRIAPEEGAVETVQHTEQVRRGPPDPHARRESPNPADRRP